MNNSKIVWYPMDHNLLTSSESLFNIGLVSRMTRIIPSTLRAWERRYGFPRPVRSKGGQRLYSNDDVNRLRWVKQQVDSGMQVRQAIHAVHQSVGDRQLDRIYQKSKQPPTAARKELTELLIEQDLEEADQLLGEMLAFYTIEELILTIMGPILAEIGDLWKNGRINVVTEHLATNYLRQRMLMWMMTGPRSRSDHPIVLACAPDEWHEGSLLMLGVLLRRQSWPVMYLGQAVPLPDLAAFVDKVDPSAVVLVAMRPETAQALSEWPDHIKQEQGRPLVAFGGRAFIERQEIIASTPGLYLGDTIEAGLEKLIHQLGRL